MWLEWIVNRLLSLADDPLPVVGSDLAHLEELAWRRP